MSNINTNDINTGYPVAGKDNDSQGFRTNFSAIALGLETAKTEIAELQAKAVLKDQLVDAQELDNNLAGNSIINGKYAQLYPKFGNRGITSESSNDNLINLDNGPVQKFTLRDADGVVSGSDNFTWSNWPLSSANVCASVRLIFTLETGISGTRNVTFDGNITYATGFPSPLQVNSSKIKVVDAWTIDGGNHIYMTYIGEY